MASKGKKDFSNIGSMAVDRFLSKDEERNDVVKKQSPMNPNIKSKRVNLLIYPSLFEKATKIAKMNQVSFNEYLNTLISQDIENNQELINTFDQVFKKK